MTLLLSILGLLTETAHAVTLDQAGAGNSGVSQMWSIVCSTLPFCDLGPEGAVEFFTGRIIAFVFSLIGLVAIILVIYAGIRLTTSQGEQDALTKAKQIVMWALIGVALALVATAAVRFVLLELITILS